MLLYWKIQLVSDKNQSAFLSPMCGNAQVMCRSLGNTEYEFIHLPRADTLADDNTYIT